MIYTSSNFHPRPDKIPFHVGLIPDGVRRWSKSNGTSLLDGYSLAMEKIGQIIELLFDRNTQVVSVYMCSAQNMFRTAEEVEAFCSAETRFCTDIAPEISKKFETKVLAVGQSAFVPPYYAEAISAIEEFSQLQSKTKLYMCIAYNPLVEIEEAIRKSLNEACFVNELKVKEPVDLIIRSSGANLISNFLPLQSGFARLYFLEKQFNDITLKDVEDVLTRFSHLSRLYGT